MTSHRPSVLRSVAPSVRLALLALVLALCAGCGTLPTAPRVIVDGSSATIGPDESAVTGDVDSHQGSDRGSDGNKKKKAGW